MAKTKTSSPPLICWRIGKKQYSENPLDGVGAQLFGGRWNRPGLPMVYTSASLSLAAMETLVHLDQDLAPIGYTSVKITVPPSLAIDAIDAKKLPKDWRTYPAPASLQDIGTEWLRELKTPLLRVPSAIVPSEFNYLINPLHMGAKQIKTRVDPFEFDPRLF